MPGPKLDVTGPYLEGKGKFALQMHDPDGLIQSVSGLVFFALGTRINPAADGWRSSQVPFSLAKLSLLPIRAR
jgi:hypothetical protein